MENINLTKIRARIAPSPTGFVHIGNLRTILYNYLFVRHHGGKFIVRIEDTDRNRFVADALTDLLKTLNWAGFDYDEGPKLDNNSITEVGEYGPYVQSNRFDIYHNHIRTLIDKNRAYPCFCSKERLETLRAKQETNGLPPKYDGACRNLNKDEVNERIKAGEEHVIRFRMPENKTVLFEDAIRGTISFNTDDLDDFVLMKADGYPTYHFANIIDDHLMKITHVLRGEEWVPSTPKHVLLYEAYDWRPPIFAHLPQILNKNKKKMSKRDGDVSVKDFINNGYLKEALINFIALLGWNSGSEQEIYTVDELVKQFSLDNVHKSGAVFDLDKLDWINGIYIRGLKPERFATECLPFLERDGLIEKLGDKYIVTDSRTEVSFNTLTKACALEQERIKKLSEITDKIRFVFAKKLQYNPETLIWKKSDREKTKGILHELKELIASIPETAFTRESLEKSVSDYIEKTGLGNGDVLWPLRVALSGLDKSPGPFEIAEVLGHERTVSRIQDAYISL